MASLVWHCWHIIRVGANDQRSHAGPMTPDCNHVAQPALAAAGSQPSLAFSSSKKTAVGITVYFLQQPSNVGRFWKRLIGMPFHIGSHPVKPPNFSSPYPPSLGNWMLKLARLVIISWANRNDSNRLPMDVSPIINFVSNLRRRSTLAEKLPRSHEALANLDIRKRHASRGLTTQARSRWRFGAPDATIATRSARAKFAAAHG